MDQSSDVQSAPTTQPGTPKKKSNKTLWIVIGVLITVFVVLPLIAFAVIGLVFRRAITSEKAGEKITESLIEKATDGKVDVDAKNGGLNITSEDGESSVGFGGTQKIPDDFPKDKIDYLDEKSVTFVLTNSSDGTKKWSVSTTVDKSFTESVQFFEDRIKEPAYTDISTYGVNTSKSFQGTKNGYSVSVTVTDTDGTTSVTYAVSEKN